jgi:peptide deformylase
LNPYFVFRTGATLRAEGPDSVRHLNRCIRIFEEQILMPAHEILQLGNPELWRPSAPVADVQARQTQELIADLAATLDEFRAQHGYGRGIAAPQIGVHRRVVFMQIGDAMPIINPRIVRASQEKVELWDDCFSFPGLMVRVRRHAEVEVAYLDDRGEARTIQAQGELSELLQHEIDHLDGILATDRAIDSRSLALRSVVK